MKFLSKKKYLTGTAIPVSALKSSLSMGIGDFLDLIPFGKWCKQNGLDIIQILPVNDSGDQSSPYSALSAMALHPIYLHLQSIPEAKSFSEEIQNIINRFNSLPRIPFREIYQIKMELLKKIYPLAASKDEERKSLTQWIRKNPWVKDYAVFKVLKDENEEKSWRDWKEFQDVDSEQLSGLWRKKSIKEKALFFIWIQRHLDLQFSQAVENLKNSGIELKGDLPIMMNEDSADVWSHRSLFNLKHRAGAPPDEFSPQGQNWGFPIYNWNTAQENLENWWKARIKLAARYYSTYRIDHVLGFFRLWTIPDSYDSGDFGFFTPHQPITRTQLYTMGWDDARICWMSEPHISEGEIYDAFGNNAREIIDSCFNRVNNEPLFRFKPAMDSHQVLFASGFSSHIQGWLRKWLRDRVLLKISENDFVPLWYYRDTKAYRSLSDGEKEIFEKRITGSIIEDEALWEEQGDRLMKFMTEASTMLPCAEDLGAIPGCVPVILNKYSIYGLKVIRWARQWNHHGQPYDRIKEYPYHSVCCTSVHDSSTLRQWWEEEKDRAPLCAALEILEPQGNELSPESAFDLLRSVMETGSRLCILPLQDFLAIDSELRDLDKNNERINTPGTVSEENWGYRMHPSIEILLTHKEFNHKIRSLTEFREHKHR